jgi:pyruvate dehydrogenase E1 component
MQVGVPSLTATDYINTIPPEREPWFPGDEDMERRLPALDPVERRDHRAPRPAARHRRRRAHLDLCVGGDALRSRAEPLLPRPGPPRRRRPDLLPGPRLPRHVRPGLPRGPFSTRTTSTASARRSSHVVDGKIRALSSYPHPRLMPDFWQFPTVSMGLGPMNAIYQAQFNRTCTTAASRTPASSTCGRSSATARWTSPSRAALLQLAANEELDNLTFVVNCNLQRLDGPVRGNGKIIQELEAFFRGAGWNVIKVVWGRGWDPLLAADRDGALVQPHEPDLRRRLPDLPGQRRQVRPRALLRRDPRTRKMVENWTDEDIWFKLRAAGTTTARCTPPTGAAEHTGQPTVILAKTIKGFTLGTHFAGRNATHQMKKLTLEDLKGFRDLPAHPDQRRAARGRPLPPPYYRPRTPSDEAIKYMLERRARSAAVAARAAHEHTRCTCPTTTAYAAGQEGLGQAGRRDDDGLRAAAQGPHAGQGVRPSASCRSSPTRRAPSGWTRSSRRSRSTTPTARTTPGRPRPDARLPRVQAGPDPAPGHQRGRLAAAFTAAGTAYATHGEPMIPIYIFYSMFGFQRTGDSIWAAADQMTRGFLIGATAGRTTLTGEGLQHADGHSPLLAATNPAVVAYDPAFGYEIAHIMQDGCERMYGEPEDPRRRNVIYYLTVYNEPMCSRPSPRTSTVEGSSAGCTSTPPPTRAAWSHTPAGLQLLASGVGVCRGRWRPSSCCRRLRGGRRRLVGHVVERAAPRRDGVRRAGVPAPRRAEHRVPFVTQAGRGAGPGARGLGLHAGRAGPDRSVGARWTSARSAPTGSASPTPARRRGGSSTSTARRWPSARCRCSPREARRRPSGLGPRLRSTGCSTSPPAASGSAGGDA